MEAFKGTTRIAFLVFFASHIPITILFDGQCVTPESRLPQFLLDLTQFEIDTFKDPLIRDARQLLWFKSVVACEVLLQLPYFFVACSYLLQSQRTVYPDAFRVASIAYGAHTATTLVPILATLATNPDATLPERGLVTALYLPYLIFPLWILYLAATTGTGNRAQTTTTKKKKQ